MPLVAEIPALKMSRADRFRVLTAEDPASLMAEAYRSLRTSIIAMWQRHPIAHGNGASNGNGNGHRRPGLAPAAHAAHHVSGSRRGQVRLRGEPRRDLRRDRRERDRRSTPTSAARSSTGTSTVRPCRTSVTSVPTSRVNDLESVLQNTDIPGVRFAASSPPKSSPGTAMAVAKAAVAVAKDLADIVIIDSPPLLLANDAADLSTFADATVLLVRAGWTRHKAVAGAADLLRRLEATTVGVVLVGAEHGTHDGYYGYYGYYGYGYGYGRGESVEDSLRHRLMPWRRPRPQPESTKPEVGVAAGESVSTEMGKEAPTGRPDEEPWV